ncbi:recombinase XerD [Roseibacterium sp. SDUM158016]|uniref:tyrosine-type recombinase/integrase n=1 Tax=Roseicyclus sediminis TaxID=2980997 RepID=UPI0021D0C97F|nr:tyrosine-type recombinase/integrase [Roseibacterium sp. SDUM158016]MCU4654703.1 recombinase XerD [Roseibacterium sp. SDUM158016]
MTTVFDREAERSATLAELARMASGKRAELIAEYQRRSEEAYAPETLRNYRQITASFRAWCEGHDYRAEPPIPPEIVAEYVETLGGKLSANTIETRLWAIAELHRSHFQPSPCRHRLVELSLKAVKRKYGARSRQAAALGKAEVLETVKRIGTSRKGLRDKALILAASDSWLRASELVALRVRDLSRQDDGSSILFVARSKTDPYGEGDYAYLSPLGSRAVLQWIDCACLGLDDPIFTKSQDGGLRTPLNPSTVSRIFKKRFGRADVSSHSTRVGGVQDALRLGCSLGSIMVAGRWRSPEMPARYGRRISASQSAAAEVAKAYERNGDNPLAD